MRSGWHLWLLVSLAVLAGCERADVAPATPAAVAATSPAPAPEAADAGVIRKLCAVLHELPNARKRGCCGHSGGDLTETCVTALSGAMRQGGIRVDSAVVHSCTTATEASLTGCDWVTPLMPEAPRVCTAMVSGALSAGAVCNSSLACADGLYCRGLGAGVAGVCAASAPIGGACETPNDPLAILLRAQEDPRHRSCAGLCLRGRCLAVADKGGQCPSSAFCAQGLSCVQGVCSDQGIAAAGAACDVQRPCQSGLICDGGICGKAKPGGASCALPFECRSLACVKADNAARGVCADVCASPQTTTGAFLGNISMH